MEVDPDVEDDLETEAEEEIDQLDSDTTEEEVPAGNTAKARQRRPVQRERVPGQTLVPLDRVETILDSEGAPWRRALLYHLVR